MNNNIDERFSMKLNEVRFQDSNGNYVPQDQIVDYLKKQRDSLLTIKESAKVGDIVKLKGKDANLVVSEVNDDEAFRYGGSEIGISDKVYVFNQEDIEEIVSLKK